MSICMIAKLKRRTDILKKCAAMAALLAILCAYLIPMSVFAEDGKCKELSDFSGKTFGMLSGTSFDIRISQSEAFTDHEKFMYFNSDVDSTSALRSGKVDAVTLDRPIAEMIASQYDDIMVFPEAVAPDPYGFGFKKGSELIPVFNEAMSKLKAEGLDEELKEKWMGTDESAKVLIPQDWKAENGTLRYWVNTGTPPMSYIGPDGTPVGYTIDLVLHVAREMGYGVEITECAFDGLIPALQSGKADLAGRSMSITEERKKSIDFSDPFYEGATVLVVRKADVDPSLIPGNTKEGKCKELSDFSGKTFGMLSGTSFDSLIPKNEAFTDHEKFLYFNSDVDSTSALRSGKVDAVTLDKPIAEMIVSQHDDIMVFPEPVAKDPYGMGFKKGSELVPLFNEAMSKLKEEGLDEELTKKWMGTDESAKVLIPQDWKAENGTLRYWVNTGTPPMSYIGPDGTPVGYTIDLVLHVAREMGYGVEITECAFDGLIPALQSGKADLAGRSMSITEERKKSIDFSDPFYEGAAVLVVRKADVDPSLIPGNMEETETPAEKKSGFLDGLARDFRATFITESRWKMILSGLGVTLIISIVSILLGTILGFVIFLLLRNRKKIQSVVDFIANLIVGIPMVVFLMIIYYIVFGSSSIGGIPISIIAFTITFSISVYRMIQTGTTAVDPGQMEGALALGYNDRQTFSDIILPQAVLYIFPIYKAELGTLLKATAIVGYIAVHDLTRMGDLIRSRTFVAFFPLIAVAIIYYLLGKLLALIANLLQHYIDPHGRKPERILKGVKEDV